jgi:hypothetical protein
MEMRQLGGTVRRVGVLGFGGAEIGSETAEPEAVARPLRDDRALRARRSQVADASRAGQAGQSRARGGRAAGRSPDRRGDG